jgi:enoyl-CoA hydratase
MEFVHYDIRDRIATIRIDDGKRNALAPAVLREIYAAFERAEADEATVILTGRDDVFSAGFDLKVMNRGGSRAIDMLRLGYGLPARLFSYPYPVVTACNGHALAMGVFLMLSADYVIGTRGDFKIAANEVAIGMTMPRIAAAVLRNRLQPAAFQRAVALAEYFDVEAAREAGFFDELVEPAELMARAESLATQFQELDMQAHTQSKRLVRKALVREIRRNVPLDLISAARQGMRRARDGSGS